ncbi:hypothetical protein D1O30_20160 [Methylocystis hirsuta]|uniref:Uncharacterized protein n=1 Tax=Methylocystis hirsuta TaxID=369798 RepID=A0A3M9XMN4_9HYPH|nr:hypothetical protein D1O30_20160 [Methylocystis hirsuta]
MAQRERASDGANVLPKAQTSIARLNVRRLRKKRKTSIRPIQQSWHGMPAVDAFKKLEAPPNTERRLI